MAKPDTTAMPRPMRSSEVARILGVSPRTVNRLGDRGVLRATRLLPRSPRLFEVADVLALLGKYRKEPK